MIFESGHLLVVLGADDLVIVHIADATIVCAKSQAQDVKKFGRPIAVNPEWCTRV